ncbi:hypothetical protein B0H16DRAFT_1494687 [Mycena metata]|uniref:Uncharacterized protein n=1 Tax=Mycena metata TaxID=1033252 RepID=A0AAD7KCI8_9AGAR|nr:hypothetical protein B0H16DRAFT_1494687 [Mycena metata]
MRPSSTMYLESQGLSTSRISRLLRPLRTKCIALTAAYPTTYAKPVAYGSRTTSDESPPLNVLPPPDASQTDHRSVATLRAALYGVQACFREIVIKTQPPEPSRAGQRVPRLADLCSTIVGENIEGEDASTAEDSDQLAAMENLYEFIPVQYRRSALLAHSLDITLRCPHHFTLLSILLDVCLQYDLEHESRFLLERLLQVAVSPIADANSPLRLCHPAHSNYLFDLLLKWNGAGRPPTGFIGILTTVLVQAARPELWSCKALTRFARGLQQQDFRSFMDMASQLVGSLVADEPHETLIRKHRTFGAEESSLTVQLNKWLNYSSPFPPSEHWPWIFEFLEQCRQSGVHRNIADPLAATVACWATHYLSITAPADDTCLHQLLKEISPTVTMYNHLIEKSFGIRQTTPPKLEEIRDILQAYACCLRAKGLLLLEASLWACALRFTETSKDLLGPCVSREKIARYREELMDLVDDAERRCFGRLGSSPCQALRPRWEWEKSLGCWAERDLPPTKKAKLHHEPCNDIHVHRTYAEDETGHGCPESTFELSFTSLISSTLSRRTKLHPSTPQRMLHPTLTYPRGQARTLHFEDTIPASEDALNLFAYTENF